MGIGDGRSDDITRCIEHPQTRVVDACCWEQDEGSNDNPRMFFLKSIGMSEVELLDEIFQKHEERRVCRESVRDV